MDSESRVGSTFVKFGVLFNTDPYDADPSVKSPEDFLVFAAENFVMNGRVAKATMTWAEANIQRLDPELVNSKLKLKSSVVQIYTAGIISQALQSINNDMLDKKWRCIIDIPASKERLLPFGEYGKFSNPIFDRFNISMPALRAEPKKYLRKVG